MNMRLLTTILILVLVAFSPKAEKYALIIAVGDYPEEGKWPDISSMNDVIHIETALGRLGFRSENIIKIADKNATKAGIMEAFRQLSARAAAGDMVYIHFSGHGQQIPDQDGDEVDGLDEAIVPYDSPLEFKKGIYEGQKLMLDDELGSITNEIRKKCGPKGQVLLILDSCHSGTGTRGMGKVRGTDKIMAPANYKPSGQKADTKQNDRNDTAADMAPMASFFGASPRELNYETRDEQSRPVGSLSYAFAAITGQIRQSESMADVFARIKQRMSMTSPRQNPQFEGTEGMSFLGGTSVAKSEEYRLTDINDRINVTGGFGTITDVFAGTTVEIYTDDPKKPVANGEVVKSYLTTCTIKLTDSLAAGDNLYKVAIKERSEPPTETSVKNMVDQSDQLYPAISRAIDTPLSRGATDDADLYVLRRDRNLKIETKEGTEIMTLAAENTSSDVMTDEIRECVRAYAQSQFLRTYENEGGKFDFSLMIKKVDCHNSKMEIAKSSPDSLFYGECVRFEVVNNGLSGAYFSLLDIQPNNQINLVIPATDLGHTADEYFLDPGEKYVTSYPIEISEPEGREVLKLILSKKPLQLQNIISTRGRTTRGVESLNSFENILASSFQVQSRGTKVKKSSNEEVGTKTLVFNIVKR